MSKPAEFSFGDQSVATSYDDKLVPVLFEPWATELVAKRPPRSTLIWKRPCAPAWTSCARNWTR